MSEPDGTMHDRSFVGRLVAHPYQLSEALELVDPDVRQLEQDDATRDGAL